MKAVIMNSNLMLKYMNLEIRIIRLSIGSR